MLSNMLPKFTMARSNWRNSPDVNLRNYLSIGEAHALWDLYLYDGTK